MTKCNPGDVVLVRFPFTDLSSVKQRPAVVVSPLALTSRQSDVVVVALTSQRQADSGLMLDAWSAAGLIKPTWFKPLIATLASKIITRRLGSLGQADRQNLSRLLDALIDGSLHSHGR